MDKAILMSIQPQWTCKELNGEKTIEVRKKFPKDYVGWVYIYCTKNGKDINGFPTELVDYRGCAIYNRFQLMYKGHKLTTDDNKPRLNGKVVARFWCDKVEHFEFETISRDISGYWFDNGEMLDKKTLKLTCLNYSELYDYIKFGGGYAIHITKLEVFDEPKELKEFGVVKAPQSYMFIEGE